MLLRSWMMEYLFAIEADNLLLSHLYFKDPSLLTSVRELSPFLTKVLAAKYSLSFDD